MRQPIPEDSRYIPLTQQKSCCVPTCFQMVMLKHQIPLRPVEEIGFHLGLVVSPERKNLFYNVRTARRRPIAGYGTRIYDPRFDPNHAFQVMNIPLRFHLKPIFIFNSVAIVADYLQEIELADRDVLLCFHHGTLSDDPNKDWGHVCVFDRIYNDQIRIIDPSPDEPKWRKVSLNKMVLAMEKHGEQRSAGFWDLSLKESK